MHNVSDIGIVNTIMMYRSAIVMAKSNPTKLVHVPRDLVACDEIGSWRVTHWQGEPKTPGRSTAQRGALSLTSCLRQLACFQQTTRDDAHILCT
jgi:hypothetical protein